MPERNARKECQKGMQLDSLVGTSVVIVSTLTKVLGEPDQIRRNWAHKSTKGVSTLLYVLGFLSYCLWTTHGLLQADLYLIVAQSVGIITSGIILVQMWMYRSRSGAG
jgi:uncharacterized protein with PQ loop repeat